MARQYIIWSGVHAFSTAANKNLSYVTKKCVIERRQVIAVDRNNGFKLIFLFSSGRLLNTCIITNRYDRWSNRNSILMGKKEKEFFSKTRYVN